MKQFMSVLRFEFLSYAKNKAFIIVTVLAFLAISITLCFPRISALFKEDVTSEVPTEDVQTTEVVAVSDLSGGDTNVLIAQLKGSMPEFVFETVDLSIDEIKSAISDEKYTSAIVVEEPLKYQYITENMGMYDRASSIVDMVLTEKYRVDSLGALGLSNEEIAAVLNAVAVGEIVEIGNNQMSSFIYTYILIFALYMAIIMYGQFVAMSVANEKGSRTMEMLITSTKSTNLIFGKVIGSGLAGLLQLAIIFGTGLVFYQLNKDVWRANMIMQSIFAMPIATVVFAIVFFVLGFFIYAFMYAALSSLANRSEDVNTLTMPITFVFVAAFMIVMVSMGSGDVNSTLMIVSSYVPFTSPMAMFVRITMGDVATFEIVISIAILLISTVGLGYLASAIYKIGVLLYGKPPKMKELVKMLRNK